MSKTGASRARGPSPPPAPPARRVGATHWCCLSRLPQGPGWWWHVPRLSSPRSIPLASVSAPHGCLQTRGACGRAPPGTVPSRRAPCGSVRPQPPAAGQAAPSPSRGGVYRSPVATKSPAQRPRAGTVPAVPVSPCSLSLRSPESPPWALCGSISTALDPVPLTGGVPWHPCPCCP